MDVTVVRRGATKSPRGTDVALYHVGNNPDAHGWIVDALRRRRGLVVLHEFVLHHLIAGLTLGRGDPNAYVDAMHRDAGVIGRLLAHGVVDHLLPRIWEDRAQDFPLAGEVLDWAEGVVCHSHYVEQQARNYGYEGPIWVVPMPAWPAVDRRERMAPKDRFPIVACLGHLNHAKRIPQLLQAFQRVRRSFPDALLVLAGSAAPDLRLDDVGTRGRRSPARLPGRERSLAAPRRLRRLREPSLADDGRDVGHGDPGALARQTACRQRRRLVLGASLTRLRPRSQWTSSRSRHWPPSSSGSRRTTAFGTKMSSAAADYARDEHDLDRVADLYLAALEEVAGGPAVRDAVLTDVAHGLPRTGYRHVRP